MIKKFFLLLACLLAIGCTEGAGDRQTAASSTRVVPADASAAHALVFFLDPNGGPCIMQAQILYGMEDELRGRAPVRYVQTTVPEDRRLFTQYGVRALPTLLLADASGREVRRLPPGVKSADEIRLLLQAIN